MLRKSTLREIKSSLARYLAIFSIVALGVGFFAGLKDTKASMVEEARNYLNACNMYDYQILSSYGIDEDSVRTAASEKGVSGAEASIQIDVLAAGENENDNEAVLKAISIPESINTVALVEGRMPQADNECLVDDYNLKGGMYKVGATIKLSSNNDKGTLKKFNEKEFKIVGRISSPLYLDYQRGSSSLGNGSLDTFFYIRESAFNTDYYTNLYVTLEGEAPAFSEEENSKLDSYEDSMEALAETITADRRETARKEAQEKLDEKKQEYEDGLKEYNDEKAAADRKIRDGESKISSGSRKLSKNKKSIQAQLSELQGNKKKLESGIAQAEKGKSDAKAAHDAELMTDEEYNQTIAKLNGTIATAKTNLKAVEKGISRCNDGLKEIDKQDNKLEKSKKELESGKKTADAEFADAKKKLDDAAEELDKAQKEIDEMETGNSYALARTENAGYSSFDSNSSIVSNIAKVFPVFFFLVAALVCMTTMTRMVDEQRTQIGILKALGYSNRAVLSKYMFYSGSGAMLGALFGFFVGCKVFPLVIWHAYTMMYSFSETVPFVFDWKLLAISLAATMLCSMGATWVSVSADFKEAPSELIRPKTPSAGKRILLERIKPVWNHLSFLYKVSMRNIFRYKKRFFMMVLGVSGCTALLIAGIGINTTISRVAEYQFGEVSLYDYQLIFSKNMDADRQADFMKFAEKETDGRVGDVLFLHSANLDAYNGKKKIEATCVATDSADFGRYINLHYGSEELPYPGDGECIIVRKVQKELGANIGDEITLKEGYRDMTVKVAGICDYYVGEVVFMNNSTYEAGMGKKPEIKTAYVLAPSGSDEVATREIATAAGQYDDVAAVSVNLDTIDVVDKMMESLKAIVFVVILCAGLLAFIVLFNLTNINITERIREIATIKVLGFNQLETSQYVFRENIFLTAIAALVGIPLGNWLLRFVIDNIVVSMIYFQPRLKPADYVIAVVLTFVFALIVNLAMQKRLRDVSMTESLKSIE
ncbi:MAG: FtsX-like permease family protein [Clostridiales bacterium]|nr:FtsX-like permease family protein [Candidatus Crickella caballi]